jgi:hypothetical protein
MTASEASTTPHRIESGARVSHATNAEPGLIVLHLLAEGYFDFLRSVEDRALGNVKTKQAR